MICGVYTSQCVHNPSADTLPLERRGNEILSDGRGSFYEGSPGLGAIALSRPRKPILGLWDTLVRREGALPDCVHPAPLGAPTGTLMAAALELLQSVAGHSVLGAYACSSALVSHGSLRVGLEIQYIVVCAS